MFGGREVDGENQTYTYFLVNGDGTFLVKTRDATSTAILVPWSEHAAVNRENAEATTSNDLAVEIGATTTRFLVNDKEVHRAPTATLKTEGLYGCRLVHDLHVKFENGVATAQP